MDVELQIQGQAMGLEHPGILVPMVGPGIYSCREQIERDDSPFFFFFFSASRVIIFVVLSPQSEKDKVQTR